MCLILCCLTLAGSGASSHKFVRTSGALEQRDVSAACHFGVKERGKSDGQNGAGVFAKPCWRTLDTFRLGSWELQGLKCLIWVYLKHPLCLTQGSQPFLSRKALASLIYTLTTTYTKCHPNYLEKGQLNSDLLVFNCVKCQKIEVKHQHIQTFYSKH